MHSTTPTRTQTPNAENIKVAIRFRPLNTAEETRGAHHVWHVTPNTVSHHDANVTYAFDHVFDQHTTTEEIYQRQIAQVVESVLQGINGTIFAYGQTSTGKTFTMTGNGLRCPGIIQFAIQDIFAQIQNTPDREFLLRVSFLEIYNEIISDLLRPSGTNLKIMMTPAGEILVSHLKEEIVTSAEQIMKYLLYGVQNRHVGNTDMNEYSSRSHTIFRLIIESRELNSEDSAVAVSTLSLVDLAGSERVSNSNAKKERLREGSHINRSLLTLGTVMRKLANGGSAGHVPYRNSKLTHILKPALGGNSRTAVICTVSPASVFEEITSMTLNFASNAKSIQNKFKKNEILDEQTLIQRLMKEIEGLKRKLRKSTQSAAEQKPNRQESYERKLEELMKCFIGHKSVAKNKRNQRRRTIHTTSFSKNIQHLASTMGPGPSIGSGEGLVPMNDIERARLEQQVENLKTRIIGAQNNEQSVRNEFEEFKTAQWHELQSKGEEIMQLQNALKSTEDQSMMEYQRLHSHIEDLNQRLRMHGQNTEALQQVQYLSQENSRTNDELKSARSVISQQSAILNQTKMKFDRASQILNQQQQELDSQRKRSNDLESALDQSFTQINELKAELRRQGQSYNTETENINTLNAQIMSLQEERDVMYNSLRNTENQMDRYRGEMQHAKNVLKNKDSNIKELSDQNHILYNNIEDLQAKYMKLCAKFDEKNCENNMHNFEVQVLELRDQRSQLQSLVTSLENEKTSMSEAFRQRLDQISQERNEQVSLLQNKVRDMQNALQGKEEALHNVKNEYHLRLQELQSQHKTEIYQLRSESDANESLSQQMQSETKSLKSDLEDQIHQRNRLNQKLQESIACVENSTIYGDYKIAELQNITKYQKEQISMIEQQTQERVESLEKTLSQFKDNEKELQIYLRDARSEQNSLRDQIRKMQDSEEAISHQFAARLQQESQNSQISLSEMKTKYEQNLSQIHQTLKEKDAIIMDFQQKFAQMQHEYGQVSKLADRYGIVTQELEQLKARFSQSLEEHEAEKSELRDHVRLETHTEFMDKIADLNAKIQMLEDQNGQLSVSLKNKESDNTRAHIKQLEAKLSETYSELNSEKDKLGLMMREHDELLRRCEGLKRDHASQQKGLQQDRQRLGEACAVNEALEKRVEGLRQREMELSELLRQSGDQRSRAAGRCDFLEEELKELRATLRGKESEWQHRLSELERQCQGEELTEQQAARMQRLMHVYADKKAQPLRGEIKRLGALLRHHGVEH